uniref:Uncharacterized protein n=1 Tax=Trichobilharzia regenti TaxID=157069 RepID=A0AA85KAZ1_TRIRE
MHVQYFFLLSIVLALCCVEGIEVTNSTIRLPDDTELVYVLIRSRCYGCLCWTDLISE